MRFDPEKLDHEASRALLSLLRNSNYDSITRLPQPDGHRWFTEPLRIAKFVTGGVNCWKQTPYPDFYAALMRWQEGDAAVVLFDLLFLGRQVGERVLAGIAGERTLRLLEEATVLSSAEGKFRSNVRAYPLKGMYFLCDPSRAHSDFVYLGWDSHLMVNVAAKYCAGRRFARALDLCTGSGVQGLSLRRQSEQLVCADINPRALAMVAANAALNGLDEVQTIHSDLFSSVSGHFDCITANTPYVPEPPGGHLPIGGGDTGIEFTMRLLKEIPDRLVASGIAIVYTSDPILDGKRRLLEQVGDRLGNLSLRVVLVPLFTNNYPFSKPLQEHYDRLGLAGYDDCILVITRSNRYSVEHHQWDAIHYYRTRLDAWLDWRRRSNARELVARKCS
jgi:methylase of polypeptide subunit release factors